jgi:hypothetical protein
MQNPATMPFPEILREIQSLRASMRADGRRIHELSRILQERVRRQETDEFTSRYVAYANACIRFAGGVEQGAQRTASFDKVVGTIEREQKQAVEKQEEDTKRAKQPKLRASASGGMADLVSLFGQEMIDAAR